MHGLVNSFANISGRNLIEFRKWRPRLLELVTRSNAPTAFQGCENGLARDFDGHVKDDSRSVPVLLSNRVVLSSKAPSVCNCSPNSGVCAGLHSHRVKYANHLSIAAGRGTGFAHSESQRLVRCVSAETVG